MTALALYIPKDVLAVKLAWTKSWPYRKQLVEFGKRICQFDRADEVIDSIADAAASHVLQIEAGEAWSMMKTEIERGCAGLAPRTSSCRVRVRMSDLTLILLILMSDLTLIL